MGFTQYQKLAKSCTTNIYTNPAKQAKTVHLTDLENLLPLPLTSLPLCQCSEYRVTNRVSCLTCLSEGSVFIPQEFDKWHICSSWNSSQGCDWPVAVLSWKAPGDSEKQGTHWQYQDASPQITLLFQVRPVSVPYSLLSFVLWMNYQPRGVLTALGRPDVLLHAKESLLGYGISGQGPRPSP